jgi:hypothetical protein
MNSRSKSSFSSPMVWALALACSMVWIGRPSAQAQFNRAAALLPSQIERMVLARGDKLTGPVVRRGPVYLANVLGREDDPERLVIDARSGRLLQRYPGEPAIVRQAAIPESVSPLTTLFDGWFGRHDDVAPSSPSPSPDILETPKLKPQVKRHKPEPMAVALPTPAPNDNKATSPVPPPATPIATDAKAASVSPPSPVAAVTPNVTTPKASASKINDVPVAPLE